MRRQRRFSYASWLQTFSADFTHQRLQHRDPLADPFELGRRDLVMRRVAGVDIGLAQQLEAALTELGVSRPCRNQGQVVAFGLRSQETQLVRLGAVEGQDEQRGVTKMLGPLMQQERSMII